MEETAPATVDELPDIQQPQPTSVVAHDGPFKSSMIYAVKNADARWFKIGYSSGSVSQLRSRYQCVYGRNLEWHTFECLPLTDPRTVEKLVHRGIRQFWVSNELYQESCLSEYLHMCSLMCGDRINM